jgi:hypothetical protein
MPLVVARAVSRLVIDYQLGLLVNDSVAPHVQSVLQSDAEALCQPTEPAWHRQPPACMTELPAHRG